MLKLNIKYELEADELRLKRRQFVAMWCFNFLLHAFLKIMLTSLLFYILFFSL